MKRIRPIARRQSFRPNLVYLEDRAVPAFGFDSAFGFGSPHETGAFGLALDGAGNQYVAGYYTGTVDFDPAHANPNGVLTSPTPTTYNIYVAKYLSDGTFSWAADLGTPPEGSGAAARVAVGGSAVYASSYGGGNVVRLDPATGATLWETAVAGGGRTLGLAVAPSGDVNVTGRYGTTQVFVSQLNPAGAVRWTKTTSGGTDSNGTEVAVDAAGNIYATGAFQGAVTFGSTSLTSVGSHDIFVWKLNATGGSVWAGRMTSTGDDRGTGIAVDGGGNVYLTGWFGSANNNFNPASGKAVTLTNRGNWDVFVAKLSPDKKGAMTLSWAKSFGGPDVDAGQRLALDGAGNVYTTGSFGGSVNFNPGSGPAYTLTSAGSSDVFVSKLTGSGSFVAAAAMGGTGYDSGRGIGVDGSDNVYTAGMYLLTADFDPTAGTYNLTASGTYADAFVSKLTQSGSPVANHFTVPGAMVSDPSTTDSTRGRRTDGDKGSAANMSRSLVANGLPSDEIDFDPVVVNPSPFAGRCARFR